MIQKKIVFYGDSNTWGYDPRGFFGDRYPEEKVWTGIISAELERNRPGAFEVINQGQNGRELPHCDYDYRHLELIMKRLTERDLFVMMLGTNDIILTAQPDADHAIGRMEDFLEWFMRKQAPKPELLILSSPYIDPEKTGDPVFELLSAETARMNEGFRTLCEQFGVRFADTAAWDIDFACDYIHFSEEGHQTFARQLLSVLREVI